MIDIDQLIARQPRPWQINVPPPRDRLHEILYKGTVLVAVYLPAKKYWTIGGDTRIERDEITHWRECSPDLLAKFKLNL